MNGPQVPFILIYETILIYKEATQETGVLNANVNKNKQHVFPKYVDEKHRKFGHVLDALRREEIYNDTSAAR